jgi:FixJ family two-component response regulator
MQQPDIPDREVFIVDDDPAVREALCMVFALDGYRVGSFPDGATLLAAARARVPACILLDVQMPGLSGLDILKELNAEAYDAPIFVISGQGDIPMAVNAIKHGALDFIEKPFDMGAVLARVRNAIAAWKRTRNGGDSGVEQLNFPGRHLLTPRELQVLARIAGGASNKEAGRDLGISPRTVEVHRARIMDKLNAKNAADLVRLVMREGRRQ